MQEAVKHVRKYLDWKSWFEGMYTNAIKAGTSAFLAFVGTNTIEAAAPQAWHGLGLNWQQACAAFGSVMVIEIVRYINAKPMPEEKSETISEGSS
jgi:hypothetical protein